MSSVHIAREEVRESACNSDQHSAKHGCWNGLCMVRAEICSVYVENSRKEIVICASRVWKHRWRGVNDGFVIDCVRAKRQCCKYAPCFSCHCYMSGQLWLRVFRYSSLCASLLPCLSTVYEHGRSQWGPWGSWTLGSLHFTLIFTKPVVKTQPYSGWKMIINRPAK